MYVTERHNTHTHTLIMYEKKNEDILAPKKCSYITVETLREKKRRIWKKHFLFFFIFYCCLQRHCAP